MNISGAAFTYEGSEFNMGAVTTKITGSNCEISSTTTNIASGEILLTAENSVDITTPSLVELINFPPSPIPKVKTGILRKVGGSMETYMTPGLAAADAIPRHIVANPAGYAFHQNGLAYTNLVMTGPWLATATAGLASLTAGAVVNITAGAAMNITATAAVNIKGLTIFLN